MAIAALCGCAASPPKLPYPAFIRADSVPEVFLAELPGVRAKRFVSDPGTRAGSYRVDLPPSWQGTSGASPDKSLEVYVLEGEISVADVELAPGGYAYLPPGSLGFNMKSSGGARVLYFLDDIAGKAAIRTPLILDSALVDWQPTGKRGVSVKELRRDPGSGARTWLRRVEAGASLPWQRSSTFREGYLVSGAMSFAECVDGRARTGRYTAGGYFQRPPDVVSGGPESVAESDSVWFLRERSAGNAEIADGCGGG